MGGYEGFGSFMSGNVEELVAAACGPDGAPELLAGGVDDDDLLPAEGQALGSAARELFALDFGRWTFVNHGAFGAAARAGSAAAERWRQRCEANSVAFVDRELFPRLVGTAAALANAVGASPSEVVLLPNATTGVNAVVKAVDLKRRALCLDVGYGSVKTLLREQCAARGAELVVANVPLRPAPSADGVVAAVEEALDARKDDGWGLAVFDAVTSNTALRLPLGRLVDACKKRGVPVLVDGAHALGALELDLRRLDADFFVSNCHKHFCAPKGSAFLWVPERWQGTVRPLVTSHGAGSGFCSEFIWDGCRDYSPLLAISTLLRWWERLGPKRVREHIECTLDVAIATLCVAWKTEPLAPADMRSNMVLVEVPGGATEATSADAKSLQDFLHFEHAVECPVKCVEGRLYVRVTAHVYNTQEDYEALAKAVLRWEGPR